MGQTQSDAQRSEGANATGADEGERPIIQTRWELKEEMRRQAYGVQSLTPKRIRTAVQNTGAFVPYGSPLGRELAVKKMREAVMFRTRHGTYSVEDGEEQFPWGRRPAFPWAMQELDLWADGAILMIGRAADEAFSWTREELRRKAALSSSPYRKAGLTKTEAREAESRRQEASRQEASRQTYDPLTGLARGVLPREKGLEVQPIGYVGYEYVRSGGRSSSGQKDAEEGVALLFERQDGGVVSVKTETFGTLMHFIRQVAPLAEKRGKILFTQPEVGVKGKRDDHAPIQVHILGRTVRGKTLEKIEAFLGSVRVDNLRRFGEGMNLLAKNPSGDGCLQADKHVEARPWPNGLTPNRGDMPDLMETFHGMAMPLCPSAEKTESIPQEWKEAIRERGTTGTSEKSSTKKSSTKESSADEAETPDGTGEEKEAVQMALNFG